MSGMMLCVGETVATEACRDLGRSQYFNLGVEIYNNVSYI